MKEIRIGPARSQSGAGPLPEGSPLTQTTGPEGRGVTTEAEAPTQTTGEPEAVEEYKLGVNDVLRIAVWGHTDMTGDFQVKKDGMIYLPLTGGIPVAGLDVSDAKAKITREIAEYIRRPQVDAEVKEYASRQILILGAVGKPGIVPLVRNTRLLDALTFAGGIHGGSQTEIFLLRRGRISAYDPLAIFEQGDMTQNIVLQNRDVLYVPANEDRRVYVLGRVSRPGIVTLSSSRMGLIEAITSAGGFMLGAVQDDVRVIRGGLDNPTLYTVDVKSFLKGRPLDSHGFKLVSGDIVFVPDSALTTWNNIIEQIRPTIDLLFTLPVNTYSNYLIIKNFTGK